MFCKNCGHTLKRGIRFCNDCGAVVSRPSIKDKLLEWCKMNTKALVVVGVIIGVIALVAWSGSEDTSTSSNTYSQPNYQTTSTSQKDILATQDRISSSVVNILCGEGDEASGGSGTIMSDKGVILTNAHVIPQNKDEEPTVEHCLVTLPDTQGKIKEIYYGVPLVIPYLSSTYDLAFISIDSEYIDKKGKSYGIYPKKFPSFMDYGCENDNPRLGEKVRVFGYPAISGDGLYLTVTDGVVSSLPNDGTIYISAKIDHGSSGGIAVDENGCMLGIPSMISGDKNESFGVLISNEIINEFMDKLNSALNKI